jgi:hypothetical protein
MGAEVLYHDPHVPAVDIAGLTVASTPLTADTVAAADCVVVLTDHSGIDYQMVARHARLVVDTRNRVPKVAEATGRIEPGPYDSNTSPAEARRLDVQCDQPTVSDSRTLSRSSHVSHRRIGGTMSVLEDPFQKKYAPFTDAELLEAFRSSRPSAPHLLVWYSLIIGVNAQVIVDLGIGNSTRVARTAARVTGGTVYSCDHNSVNFGEYDGYTQDEWHFACLPVQEFLPKIPDPIDVAFHDASHEHDVVYEDLLALFPKMRRYGLICVHDTQHPRYRLLEAVSEAIDSAAGQQALSYTTLPYGAGLTILRAETGIEPPITPVGQYIGDRVVTVPKPPPQASMISLNPTLSRDPDQA